MGQYWMMINIDKREILKNNRGLKLRSILFNSVTANLAPLLAKPRLPVRRQYDRDPSGGSETLTSSTQDNSPLLNLPIEILVYMAANIFSPTEMICLALTCKLLWQTLHQNVCRALTIGHGSWAGDRLLLLGDYADNLPAGLLTSAEEEELAIWRGRDCECLLNGNYQCECDQRCCWEGHCCQGLPENTSMYNLAAENYRKRCPYSVFREAKFLICDQLEEDLERLEDLASELLAFPAGPWVLRNLTARQYVRLDAISQHQARSDVLSEDDLQLLGAVVVLFAQWTDDPSGTIGGRHGSWAGHRFDVCRMDEIQNDTSGAWKDVSRNARGRLVSAELLEYEGEEDED